MGSLIGLWLTLDTFVGASLELDLALLLNSGRSATSCSLSCDKMGVLGSFAPDLELDFSFLGSEISSSLSSDQGLFFFARVFLGLELAVAFLEDFG